MKKVTLFIIVISITLISQKGFSQLFTFTFNAYTCSSQGCALASQPANVTVSTVHTNTVNCVQTTDCFNTSGWGTSFDVNSFIEVTVTASAGYRINSSAIGFTTFRSSTGPVNGRVSHDGGTGTFTINNDFSISTSISTINWYFNAFNSSIGGVVKFRIYGWGASSSSGTMRIDDLFVNATVTANNPLVVDNQANLIGIGKTPTQKLDVDGNIRTNTKVLIGNITDAEIASSKIAPYALAVNGDAIFNKAKVKSYVNWPDYVFEKQYALITLEDLEQYLIKNKHLPNVPSAKEIEKDGVDLGMIQALLLQKIEELTLYTIEQKKKMQLQQTQIDELKNSTKK